MTWKDHCLSNWDTGFVTWIWVIETYFRTQTKLSIVAQASLDQKLLPGWRWELETLVNRSLLARYSWHVVQQWSKETLCPPQKKTEKDQYWMLFSNVNKHALHLHTHTHSYTHIFILIHYLHSEIYRSIQYICFISLHNLRPQHEIFFIHCLCGNGL